MEHAEESRHHHFKLIAVAITAILLIAATLVLVFILLPKPLVVTGTLKTKDGPVPAGTYDFRLKFYDATTRTDLVYSYDATQVAVDSKGQFKTDVPEGKKLNVATLMQVCIAASDSAVPGTVTGTKDTLPSCEVQVATTTTTTYNQTICGLTTVDQNPTNPVNWLASKNVVYAMPTKACGQSSDGEVASMSSTDTVAPLLQTPGALGELVAGGVGLQPGTILTIGQDGQITATAPAEVVGPAVQEEIAENEASSQSQPPAPSTVADVPVSDSQTLSLNGNILSISGGNSVELPAGTTADADTEVGNEVTDVTGTGLVRVGAGTTLDPFKVGLMSCASGQVLKSTGVMAWSCGGDADTTYTAGTGISFTGATINNDGVLSFTLPGGGGLANTGSSQHVALKLQDCANGEILQFTSGAWNCTPPGGVSAYSFTISDTSTSQPITNGDTVAFIGNEGLAATVTAGDNVTYGIANSGVTTVKLADGSITTPKIVDGAVTTVKLADGSVTNTKLANSSVTVTAGSGLSGGGVAALGSGTTLNLQACANGQILKHNGTTWVCAADSGDTNTDNQTLNIVANAPSGANTVTYDLSISGGNTVHFDDRDTFYTALTGGGLALNGAAFSLQACPVGQLLKSTNASTPTYGCAVDADTDTNTTYSAGTGLSLSGTTFNANVGSGLGVNGSNQIINSGVLSVGGNGAITSTGGQNPTLAFANGSVAGQFWQWDGDSWELATLPIDGDSVLGNEVTGVTGSNSGLVRSGSGTIVSPYTLAVSVGNGLQLTGGNVAINSPTCSGTTKLQWNGTAFGCSADVDTDTTNFSITDGSTSQAVNASQAITFVGDSNTKTRVTLGGTRQITFGLDTAGASSGQVLTYSGTGLAWQTPATYAPTTCSVSGAYFCAGGNTFGATATIGTNDAQGLAFETNNSQRMFLDSNGQLGIGTSSPGETLHLDRGATDNFMKVTNDSTGHTATDGLSVGLQSTGDAFFFNYEAKTMQIGTNATSQITIVSSGGTGNVGISQMSPAVRLHVGSNLITSGTVVARFENAGGVCNVTPNITSGVSCTSDEQLKKNVEDYNNALDAVNKLDVKEYNMKTDSQGARKQIGLMAQELEKVFPGLVSTDERGYKSVAYGGLVPVLAQAVKEQQVEIDQLKAGVWSGGIVSKDTTFKAQTIFEGPAQFKGEASFANNVSVTDKLGLSKDQVGSVTVAAGSRLAFVTFGKAYEAAPYVTATPREFLERDGQYRIAAVSKTGFIIELSQPQPKPVSFDWHAFSR